MSPLITFCQMNLNTDSTILFFFSRSYTLYFGLINLARVQETNSRCIRHPESAKDLAHGTTSYGMQIEHHAYKATRMCKKNQICGGCISNMVEVDIPIDS